MKKSTLVKIIDLMNVTCKDNLRPHISGVLAESCGDSIVLVATDGHKLVTSEIKDNMPFGKWFFPVEMIAVIKQIIKDCPKYGDYDKIACALKDSSTNSPLLISSPASAGLTINISEARNYPEYSKVIPRYDEKETLTISFNAEYLAQIANALNSKRSIIKLTVHKKDMLKPFVVKSGDDQSLGVLMPCRM